MPIQNTYEKLLSFPNGKKVAERIIQLTNFGLEPQNSYLYDSAQRVIDVIAEHEESLLDRKWLDIVTKGEVIKPFRRALKDSTEEEWREFNSKVKTPPFEQEGIDRLLSDASGLVRGTGFEDWVLGKKEITQVESETLIERATFNRK